MSGYIETYRGVAYPWLCDMMGHLTTQYYLGMFDQASWHLFLAMGFSPDTIAKTQLGWVDVKNVIEYKREVPMGGLVRIESGVTRVGTKSIEAFHVMRNAADGQTHATLLAVTVYFDLKARTGLPLPADLREKARSLLVALPATAVPGS